MMLHGASWTMPGQFSKLWRAKTVRSSSLYSMSNPVHSTAATAATVDGSSSNPQAVSTVVGQKGQQDATKSSGDGGEGHSSSSAVVESSDHPLETPAAPDGGIQEEQPPPTTLSLSKNQLKKKRRWEKKMEIKKRRKLQEREVKEARAAAQGRDIEAERRQQQEAAARAATNNRRSIQWEKEKGHLLERSFQVCLDCAFEESMTPKELNSLASQLRYCYSANKRNPHPCRLAATSVKGMTLEHLKNVSGFAQWSKRAFTVTSDPLEQYYNYNNNNNSNNNGLENVVYLTSDSDHVLQDLDDSKIYVIGGIVDRNRLRRAALDRATGLGVATARLPIDEYLKLGGATRVLTVNAVFELLLQHRQHNGNWTQALLQVLPRRKDAKALENGYDETKNKNGADDADDDCAKEESPSSKPGAKDDDESKEKPQIQEKDGEVKSDSSCSDVDLATNPKWNNTE